MQIMVLLPTNLSPQNIPDSHEFVLINYLFDQKKKKKHFPSKAPLTFKLFCACCFFSPCDTFNIETSNFWHERDSCCVLH